MTTLYFFDYPELAVPKVGDIVQDMSSITPIPGVWVVTRVIARDLFNDGVLDCAVELSPTDADAENPRPAYIFRIDDENVVGDWLAATD